MQPLLNWVREPKDPRDHHLIQSLVAVPIPNAVSNKRFMSPVKNQGNLGCCVGEGSTAGIEYTERQWGTDPSFIGSELFAYYNARQDKSRDTGAFVRDSIKAMSKLGVAHESLWPFDVSKFAQKPPPYVYIDGVKQLITKYARVGTFAELTRALAQHHVVVGGFDCFESLFQAKKGMIPVPMAGEKIVGGHCICFSGYNLKLGIVEFKNSWGPSWGDDGYGYLPKWFWDNNHVDDCWVLYK